MGMTIESSSNRPSLYSWCKDIEEGAYVQAGHVRDLPMLFRHVALMPDAHQGYGMPIGGVAALKGAISPNMVGVDIGCGMVAVKLHRNSEHLPKDELKRILGRIREEIPVGFNHRKEKHIEECMPDITMHEEHLMPIVMEQYEKARYQLGTLGGGNHFIEIQKDKEDYIWVMIHSGSRNIGFKVAANANSVAKRLNKQWYTSINSKHDLAILPIDSTEGQMYIAEMEYCIEFARLNREHMMDIVIGILFENEDYFSMTVGDRINIAHNYARMENHFGSNVMIHRKGATSAREGEIGIIPGSQGTHSYITEGLGNPDSFNSCSHGAGRTMSRKKAKETLDIIHEQDILKDVIHSVRNKADLDEAPSAYKDIHMVMNTQKDLTKILQELTPLAVVKG